MELTPECHQKNMLDAKVCSVKEQLEKLMKEPNVQLSRQEMASLKASECSYMNMIY